VIITIGPKLLHPCSSSAPYKISVSFWRTSRCYLSCSRVQSVSCPCSLAEWGKAGSVSGLIGVPG